MESRSDTPITPQPDAEPPYVTEQQNIDNTDGEIAQNFRAHWRSATNSNNLSLFCFRRYRSSHLLNLRFLEDEIAKLDHHLYQAGLQVEIDPDSQDRMGLRTATRDKDVRPIEEAINRNLILDLRKLINEYGKIIIFPEKIPLEQVELIRDIDAAILAFNQIMNFQTVALSDSTWLSSLRTDISQEEMYKTKLLRIDLPPSSQRDPIQYLLHRYLRRLWYKKRTKVSSPEAPGLSRGGHLQSHQNTIRIADTLARFLFACIAGVLLVFPLYVLSYQSTLESHLITVSLCIVVFSFLLSLLWQSSNQQALEVVAAYTAVLVVFLTSANSSCS